MALKGTRNLNAGARIAMVFAAAGLAGYAWRFFGEIGNGTVVLGLFAALFFIAFFGNRKAVAYESLPVAVALAAATGAPFYANGLLPLILPRWGAVLIGFSLLPLFALWIGTRLSKRGWKLWEILVLTAGFFALAIPLRLFAAPHLPSIAMRVNDTLCRAAANAAAAVIVFTAAGIWKKDPVASLVPLGLSCTGGLAALGAALVHRRSYAGNDVIAYLLTSDETASFFALFLMGLFGALVLVCLPEKLLAGEGKFKLRSPIASRHGRWLFNALFVLFAVALLPAYKCGLLVLDLLHWSFFDPWFLVYGVLALAALIGALMIARKNILVRCLHVPVKARPEDFALRALPAVVGLCVLCDLITIGEETLSNRRLLGGLLPALKAATTIPMDLALCGAALFFVSYLIAAKCVRLHKS
ncbi:MAG: hypothetical protein IJK64_10595 [Clostridia bacterium]|nr:hypothetical protein [Clostridia bacterium]